MPDDCLDYRIIDALVNQLKTMSTGYNTVVNDVFIPKKVLRITNYPSILVFFDQSNLSNEGLLLEQSTLEVVLVYLDGKKDDDSEESYVVRYRNVGADIRKCLMSNFGLGGLYQNMTIDSSQPYLIHKGKEPPVEAHLTLLNITRIQDLFDPYLQIGV